MAEDQQQRYVCKICDKSCVSGKSLGGHMRVHLAFISASKKAAKAKAKKSKMKSEIDQCLDDDEDQEDFSYNLRKTKKSIEDCEQNSSYELRDNPKKSWRLSDSKHGLKKKGAVACKECGKKFPTLRGLSGHMRSHSIENENKTTTMMNTCKECGKGFDSMRAMFGHMKSHSKKSKRVTDEYCVAADHHGLSDWENLCVVRRKRSRIVYKVNPNPSFTSLNNNASSSDCVVSDLGEVHEAASCLMLLSRGVVDFVVCDYAVKESSSDDDDDDSVYFGSKSDFKCMESAGNSDCDKKSWKLENCVYGSANSFADKNVCEFGESSNVFASAEDEMKVGFEVSEQFNESVVKFDVCANGSCKKACISDRDSVLAKSSCENDVTDVEILKSFENKPEKKCRIRDKIFQSERALGIHSARHKMKGKMSSLADSKLDETEQANGEAGIVSLESRKGKEHECPVCFKVFFSGQALGGHKRAHYNTAVVNDINTRETMAVNRKVSDVNGLFDLNFPAHVDGRGGAKGNFWWAENGNEHETLVLTT